MSLASQDVARVVIADEILGNLLKAINQSIIAVPFVFLKSKLPFKDVSNYWDIVIELEDECITVYHTKQGNVRILVFAVLTRSLCNAFAVLTRSLFLRGR